MKRGCTAVQRTVTNGEMLECPDSLGEKSENVDFGGFSKTRSINYSGGNARMRQEGNPPVSQAPRGLQHHRDVSQHDTGKEGG